MDRNTRRHMVRDAYRIEYDYHDIRSVTRTACSKAYAGISGVPPIEDPTKRLHRIDSQYQNWFDDSYLPKLYRQ